MRDCIRDLVEDRGMTDYLGWSREVEVVLCFLCYAVQRKSVKIKECLRKAEPRPIQVKWRLANPFL